MKIMSLNVNRFSGMEERDYTKYFTSLDKCPKANEIVAFVKGFLYGASDGVVFLQEVPFWIGKGPGKNFWRRERELLKNFCKKFPVEQYGISTPGKKAYSCTLAIWNKKGGWEESEEHILGIYLDKKDDYANKYVELKGNGLLVLGLHASLDYSFLSAVEKYTKDHQGEKLIILGDFNVTTNDQRIEKAEKEDALEILKRYNWYNGIIDKVGYTDAGDKNTITYFPAGTAVDHVLVSPPLKNKVTAHVIPRSELELSDHAVIIVEIDDKQVFRNES